MGWIEKTRTANFESLPLAGLVFLDGDLVARALLGASAGLEAPIFKAVPVTGWKYPRIVFPSGVACDLSEGRHPEHPTIHLFGEMDLPYAGTFEEILTQAHAIAAELEYRVIDDGRHRIKLFGEEELEAYVLIFDEATYRLIDIQPISPEPRPRLPLLDKETRQRLPKLYSQEALGMEALAQVKFFLPGSGWTWYATEFDGSDVFFGLVSGWEIELGYFTLSELDDVRTRSGARVERDRSFSPTSLKQLKQRHEQLRGE